MEQEKRFEFVQVEIVNNDSCYTEYEVGKRYSAIKDNLAIEYDEDQPYGLIPPNVSQIHMNTIAEAMVVSNIEGSCVALCGTDIKVDWMYNYEVEVEEI